MNIVSAILLLIICIAASIIYPQVLIAGKVIFIVLLSIAMIFISSYIAGEIWDRIESYCVAKLNWKPDDNLAQIVRMVIIGIIVFCYVTGMHRIFD